MPFNAKTAYKALAMQGGRASARKMRELGYPNLVKATAVRMAAYAQRRRERDYATMLAVLAEIAPHLLANVPPLQRDA